MTEKVTRLHISLEDQLAQAIKDFESASGYRVTRVTVDHLLKSQVMISADIESKRAV